MMARNSVHTVYKVDGEKVPSVTTVLGMLAKPALMHWAWQQGIDGKDYRKVAGEAASIGTIAHYMIECALKGKDPDLSAYPQADIDKAENAYLAYLEWADGNEITPILVEHKFVSPIYKFGGTVDLVATLRGGEKALIDLKTSKGIYPDMRVQVAAYAYGLLETGNPVDTCHILRIDKETGQFEHYKLGSVATLEREWNFFKALLVAYRMWQEIKGGVRC